MLLYRELILLVGIFLAVPPWHPSSFYLVTWNQISRLVGTSCVLRTRAFGRRAGGLHHKEPFLGYVPSHWGCFGCISLPGRRLGLSESAWALVGPKAGSATCEWWELGPTFFEPPFPLYKMGGRWWYLPVELSSEAPCVQPQHKVTAAWVVAVMITGSSSLWCVPGIMPHIMPAVT